MKQVHIFIFRLDLSRRSRTISECLKQNPVGGVQVQKSAMIQFVQFYNWG